MSTENLAELQQWFQAICTYERGPGAYGSERDEPVKTHVRSDARLTADARLSIYARAYRARLCESLREQFPTLLKVLNDELFDCFAHKFVSEVQPKGHSLRDLGGAFADWLMATKPNHEAWAAFVTELAGLERLRDEVHFGPGHERNSTLVKPPQADPWVLAIMPSPSLRIFTTHYRLDAYFSSNPPQHIPDAPETAPIHFAVFRQEWRLQMSPLTQQQKAWLENLSREKVTRLPGRPHLNPILPWLEMGLLIESHATGKR